MRLGEATTVFINDYGEIYHVVNFKQVCIFFFCLICDSHRDSHCHIFRSVSNAPLNSIMLIRQSNRSLIDTEVISTQDMGHLQINV